MRINYREPYWIKFTWDMDTHHENQYVTEYNKIENEVFEEFLHKKNWIISVNFKITKDYKTDNICMIFGKPGKNMGLSYNKESGILAFEFWTGTGENDQFHFAPFNYLTRLDVENGVTISIVREKNKFYLYKNFECVNVYQFKHNLINDYKVMGLFIGCSSPTVDTVEHRYHGEMDINYMSFIDNTSDIEIAKELYTTPTDLVLNKQYYRDILFLYDFQTVNNLGIVYDESPYNNFMEKVPLEFIS
jgi:hypothetical protein